MSHMYKQLSKRTLFDPNLIWANHSSADSFGSMFGSIFQTFCLTHVHKHAPSASWKFRSHPGYLVIFLEIIFGSCKCVPRALMTTGKQSVTDALPGGIWLAWVHSVGKWWRCDFSMKRNRSPDAQIQIFGLVLGDCASSIFNAVSVPSTSSSNSDD